MHKVSMSCMEVRNGATVAYALSYPFHQTDGGRSLSKRPRQNNDCTVRAVALAFGWSYDQAYDWLAAEGRECSRGFHLDEFLAERGAKQISFPAVRGQRRMNPATFCDQFKTGRYICRVAKHVFAVIDGVVHDSLEQRPDRCIYKAWEITGTI